MTAPSPAFAWQSPTIDAEMTRAYGEVNNDANAIHYDEAAARAAGFERPIVHGAITLALIHEACTRHFGPHWMDRGRLDVRLHKPLFVGSSVHVELTPDTHEGGDASLALSATSSMGVVVASGRARLSSGE